MVHVMPGNCSDAGMGYSSRQKQNAGEDGDGDVKILFHRLPPVLLSSDRASSFSYDATKQSMCLESYYHGDLMVQILASQVACPLELSLCRPPAILI